MSIKFVFLVLPKVNIMDLAGPSQVIQESIMQGADFEIEHCSINKPVETLSGLPIGRLKHFSEIKLEPNDFLFVPASKVDYLVSDEFRKETELFEWISSVYASGVTVCSTCAGAFILANSGILNNKPCTTHFKKTKQLQQLYPSVKVTENILFTEQNRIYTSAGVASGIDMTLYILEKLKGSYFAHKIARELVIYNRRTGEHCQHSNFLKFRNHIHSGIHKTQDYVHENMNVKISLGDLASMANMSDRNFSRIFKKETGVTVTEYIKTLRKEKIKELRKNPDISQVEIAKMCGLKSERQLRRIINNN